MKLEYPLSGLFNQCQTICVAECCGIDAFDFNPIHIASYLILHRGVPDEAQLAQIRAQLAALKSNYGAAGTSAVGVTVDQLNQGFSGDEVDALVDRISTNLDTALELIRQVEPSQSRR